MPNNNKTFGESIKIARKKAGITQKELAQKTGLAEITIRQYETSKREPGMDKLEKIANALDIDIDTLVGWDRKLSVEENLKKSPLATKVMYNTIKNSFDTKMFTTIKNSFDDKIYNTIKNSFDDEMFTAIKKSFDDKIVEISFSTADYTPNELLQILDFAEFLKNKRNKEE